MALALAAMTVPASAAQFSERELQQSCGTCHPLDPVRAARLSRADWSRELDKMQVIGAHIKDRRVLLDYLVAHYGIRKTAIRATPVR